MNNNQVQKSTNTMSILGIIFAFLFFPLGLIFSIVGLIQAKKENSPKACSIVGIVISSIGTFICVLALMFSTILWPSVKNNINHNTYCSQAISCVDSTETGKQECTYCIDQNCTEKGTIICPKK